MWNNNGSIIIIIQFANRNVARAGPSPLAQGNQGPKLKRGPIFSQSFGFSSLKPGSSLVVVSTQIPQFIVIQRTLYMTETETESLHLRWLNYRYQKKIEKSSQSLRLRCQREARNWAVSSSSLPTTQRLFDGSTYINPPTIHGDLPPFSPPLLSPPSFNTRAFETQKTSNEAARVGQGQLGCC